MVFAMSNFQSTTPESRPSEAAAGLVQVETAEPWRGMTDNPVGTGSSDPDAVRLAASQAIDQVHASLEAVAKYAEQRPGKALIAAVLLGIVLGRLM